MGAKLTYQDILNDELAPSKFVSSPNLNISTGSGAPVYSTQGGSIYVDSTAGVFYVNNSGSSGSTWAVIGNVSFNIENNHYRKSTITGTVASTTTSAPIIGDLVGVWGGGAWAASGALTYTSQAAANAGGFFSGIAASGGSFTPGNASYSNCVTFNGSTWANSANITQTTGEASGFGSQNSMGQVGGSGTAGGGGLLFSTSLLFNGSTWLQSGVLSQSKISLSAAGTVNAAWCAGGLGGNSSQTSTYFSTVETFNGTNWLVNAGSIPVATAQPVGTGSFNAGLFIGGTSTSGTNSLTTTCIFNGSTFFTSAGMASGRGSFPSAGGSTGAAWVISSNVVGGELFNGITWTSDASSAIGAAGTCGNYAGGQQSHYIAGGYNSGFGTNQTSAFTQSTYRKLYSRDIKTAKSLGIYTGSSTILLKGYDTTVTYPPNSYLVVNKSMMTAVANEVDISGTFTIASIQSGGTNIWNYNLSTATSMLQVMPGMIIFVTGASNPVNNGTFVVTFVNNSTPYFSVTNASGVVQAGSAGTLTICSTMMAVTNPSPQDIVIGKTDPSGFITLTKGDVASSVLARLR